ncbi:MAG: cytochrome c [Polynucleobacter sp.]|jgi:cytochrome c|nr:cytochrome c [Polynucleobacter sp.]
MQLAKTLAALAALSLIGACANQSKQASVDPSLTPKFGKPISEQNLVLWNIDVRTPDGLNMPPGSGTIAQGKAIYEAKCQSCHGADAKGGPVFGTMVGGIGSMDKNPRVLTPGSMYPYAPILFDYVRRAMPMNEPQSLTNDETYAVTGYLYNLNGLMDANTVVNSKTLTELKMPNRGNFYRDDRPDTNAKRCMSDCQPISVSQK